MFKKDDIYQTGVSEVTDFSFDERVAQVFPDMVHRSIPGYAALLTVIQAVFSHHFNAGNTTTDTLIYDLGCSVGGVTMALANVLPSKTRFIGIDLSEEMLAQYQTAITQAKLNNRVQMQHADITELTLEPCDAICLNFVLQFIEPSKRNAVLSDCLQALHPGGICFVAEKVTSDDSITDYHARFKRNNGYSELEIAKKRQAIENVMKIDDAKCIVSRATAVGFQPIHSVFYALGFQAWVMQKPL